MSPRPIPSEIAIADWKRRAGEHGLELVVTNQGHHWRFRPSGSARTLLSYWPASHKAQAPGRPVEQLDGPEAALTRALAVLATLRAA